MRLVRKLVLPSAVAALAGWSALSGAPAQANPCNITQDRSPAVATAASSITFVNQSSRTLDIFWLDYAGTRVKYSTLNPGQSIDQPTYAQHPWMAVDKQGICRGYVIARSEPITYTIVDDAPEPTPTPSPSPGPTTTPTPDPTPPSTEQPLSDPDHDGVVGAADACPSTPRGAFDANNDGCPGPYKRIAASLKSAWVVDDSGVTLIRPVIRPLPVGATVRLTCRPCRVGQTLTAGRRRVPLDKLDERRLRRGRGFTLMITKVGYIGQIVRYTVKRYGHQESDFQRVATDPFTETRRCIPIGSDKPAKRCSATPPAGP